MARLHKPFVRTRVAYSSIVRRILLRLSFFVTMLSAASVQAEEIVVVLGGRNMAGFGPSLETILETASGEDVTLVNRAVSSSRVSTWTEGGANYSAAVSAIAAVTNENTRIRAVVWCQGVSDVSASYRATYVESVQSLAAGLRGEFALGVDVPFIAVTLPEALEVDGNGSGTVVHLRALNRLIRTLPSCISGCVLVEGKDLMPLSSGFTFNSRSQEILSGMVAHALFEFERKVSGGRLSPSEIETQAISGDDPITPPLSVADSTTGDAADASSYSVSYSVPQGPGWGVAVVSGKEGTPYEGEVTYAPFRIIQPVFAASDGSNAADGSSWAAATTLTNALVKAGASKEVWLKAGNYGVASPYSFKTACIVRGGYRGCAGELAENPISVLDGSNAVSRIFTNTYTDFQNRGAYFLFDRIGFTRVTTGAVYRGGQGRTEFNRCRFFDISKATGSGLAIHVAATYIKQGVVIRNSSFCNLRLTGGTWIGYGLCVAVDNAASLVIEDSLFVSNGVPWSYSVPSTQLHGKGSLVSGSSVPFEIRRCEFRANRLTASGKDGCNLISFNGTGRTNILERCLIAGNQFIGRGTGNQYYKSTTSGDGMVSVVSGAKLVVDFSTIAYNTSDTKYSPAGVLVNNGYASVRNSIIYGNIVTSAAGVGADLHLTSSGRASVGNSLLTADGAASYTTATADNLDMSGCVYGDPEFVTSLDCVTNLLSSTKAGAATYSATHVQSCHYFPADNQDKVASFDLHLKSEAGTCLNDGKWTNFTGCVSAAIDMAGEDEDFSSEPSPNGARANLGCYGGTKKASKSSVANPCFSGDIGVTFPNGITQPYVSIACDDAQGGAYSGTLTVMCGTGGVFTVTNVWTAVSPGATLEGYLSECFPPGAEVTMKAVLEAGGNTAVATQTVVAQGRIHPSYGRGGGPAVVHVRPGATGRGDGSDWFNAYDCDFNSALVFLDVNRTNLWFAGETNVVETTPAVYAPSFASILRGGFKGTENSPSERGEGAITVLDGRSTFQPLTVQPRRALVIDSFSFENGNPRGFSKSFPGAIAETDLTLLNCRFLANGRANAGEVQGRGAYLRGAYLDAATTSAGVLTISNCVFGGNYCESDAYDNNLVKSGCGGAYIRAWKRVFIDGCVFTNNCNKFFYTYSSSGMAATYGAAFHALYAPVTARRCDFSFNHGGTGNGSQFGGIVSIATGGGGSAFTNCLFMGNIEQWHNNTKQGSFNGGPLRLETGDTNAPVEVANCTFFSNLSDGYHVSAGVNVRSGAVRVRNCIFAANKVGYLRSADAGDDLLVQTNAHADIAYTMFSSRESVTNRLGGNIVFGEGVTFGDPLLVTPVETALGAMVDANGSQGKTTWFDPSRRESVTRFCAHLRGGSGYYDERTGELKRFAGRSPAIDAGDPSYSFALEPDCAQGWHGRRVNLGAYGNTPYATMSYFPGAVLRVR